MSVVIVGGNERMIRQYEQLCKSYSCKAKVYIETDKGIQNFGTPDLVCFSQAQCLIKCFRLPPGRRNERTFALQEIIQVQWLH